MNKDLVICPMCGSQDVARFEKQSLTQLTLGDRFAFKEIYFKCNSCKEEGDFLAETDKYYLIAQKEAQGKLVKQILENLSEAGIAMAMLERVFELPIKTLTRWKGGDFSSSAIALLRIIITYPWIIEVAEHRFDSNFASQAVIKAAIKEFEQEAKKALATPSESLEIKNRSSISCGVINISSQALKIQRSSAQILGA